MSKEELALELTKIAYAKSKKYDVLPRSDWKDEEKQITDMYNYIYENLNIQGEGQ